MRELLGSLVESVSQLGSRIGSASGTPGKSPMSQRIYGSQGQLESQPSIEFQPTSLEYQAQEVGSSGPVQQVQLHNHATWPVILSDLQLEGEQAADFSVYADTHGTVEPGDSLPVDVLFSPSEAGTRNAHVSALADDGFGAYLALMGIGTKAGSVNEGQPGNQNDGIASHAESPEAAQTESLEDGDIASNLASIQIVHKTRSRLMLEPWKIFEKYPANNQKKKRLYTAVDQAKRALRKAEQAFAAAEEGEAKEKALAAFQDAAAKAETATHALRDAIIGSYWKDHEAGQTAKREEAAQRKRLEKLQEEAKKNKSEEHAKKLADARKKLEQLTALKGEYYADVEVEVESRMELAMQEQNIYEVTVDGETIRLVDHVNAYATVLAEGLDGDALEEKQQGKSKMIDDALDAGNFSDSIKKILSTVAKHEGGFTTINTYDKAVLTWGFMQWTGGNRSDLTAALRIIKDVQPEAFERRFQRYGIDVQRNQLFITDAEGNQVKGDAAAEALRASPALTGVISRAGLDEDIQAGQIEAAIRFKIDKVLAYKAKIDQADGSPVEIRIGDVVTSEYGVGLLADHAVHGGEWGAMKAARDGLRAYVAANPDIDLSRPSDWASDAEPEMWDTITAGWTDRAASLEKNGCSQDAGSFVR